MKQMRIVIPPHCEPFTPVLLHSNRENPPPPPPPAEREAITHFSGREWKRVAKMQEI